MDIEKLLIANGCCHCGFNSDPVSLRLINLRTNACDDSFNRPTQYSEEGFIIRNKTSVCICNNCHAIFINSDNIDAVFSVVSSFKPLNYDCWKPD